MRNFFILLFHIALLLLSSIVSGQVLTVNSGTISVKEGTVLNLYQTSLTNNHEFKTKPGSQIVIAGNKTTYLSGASEIALHTLVLNTDCLLSTNLSIIDTINLKSGSLDLGDYYMTLDGLIQNENDFNNIYSMGNGEIIKVAEVEINKSKDPGNIGLEISSPSMLGELEIRRGHKEIQLSSGSSINRYFVLPYQAESQTLTFKYLNSELNLNNESNLELWGETDNKWESLSGFVIDTTKNEVTFDLSEEVQRISLFSPEIVNPVIPGGFSPNGDGVNDNLIIAGADLYPNNKLIVFNARGDIVYQASPYLNDWYGESDNVYAVDQGNKLRDGTYFYVFYREANNKSTITKGNIEIRGSID